MIEKAQCRSRSEIRNDEKVRNIWYQFWLKKERNGIIEWWYGMMIWMMISNDEKREMELMNDYSNWKRERNGKNEWWKERNRGDE